MNLEPFGEAAMPSLTIPDELFERLTKRAAALNVTVEELIAPLLDVAAESAQSGHLSPSPTEEPFDDWKKKFDSWMVDVRARAHRYPPGFVMDDSRESIYERSGE
jgi:hypothetical protein